MKRLVVALGLTLLLLLPSGVSEQYREGKIDILVLSPEDPLLQGLSQPFSDQLSHLLHRDVKVRYPRKPSISVRAGTGEEFSRTDGSQLALMSVVPIVHTTHLSDLVKTVALLGRLDLAVFVGEDSNIHNLEDFKNQPQKVVTVGVT